MRAEGLSIALRARTPWEATDLGIALVREYAAPIWRAWACVVLPTALMLGVICQLLDSFAIASLLLWWLKPVFDRIPLYVLSRAVFGAVPSLQDTLRAQRTRADFGVLFAQLTWRRLHPMRALFLPVDFLERLSGRQRSARTSLLARAQGSPSALLTFVCVNMETMLLASILLSAVIFVPTEFFSDAMQDTLKHLFTEPPIWMQWLIYAAYTLALSIIEPIYVGAGFGLYLNRRMELEAWDIDLAFRQLALKLHERASSVARGLQLALLLGVLAAVASHSENSYAAKMNFETDVRTVRPEPVEGQSSMVSNGRPGFARAPLIALFPVSPDKALHFDKLSANGSFDQECQTYICGNNRYASYQAQTKTSKPPTEARDSETPGLYAESRAERESAEPPQAKTLEQNLEEHFVSPNPQFDAAIKKALAGPELNPKATIVEWQRKVPEPDVKNDPFRFTGFKGLANGFGFLLQNALWILLAIALVLLLPYLLRLFGALEPRAKSVRRVEDVSLFDAEAAEKLPPDIAAAVTQLWQQGNRRGALALLYRAGVLRLCDRLGQPLPIAATESECLRMARELAEADGHRVLFPSLVRHWQAIAYASREPSWEEVQSLLARWQADSVIRQL